ncbi:hypothetical protein VOLCADRAFT_88551 [Volvox carteri f. nagariensis]|uniref:Uncharacterized protein n=1 Tax=Volvox carteri f. nagariensis TaxID=3068 RepID=D8TPB0_VOLCA|nr:uncharacterized protein VOLCADRAFT_88551 [Volvox carteri f. nagariensis]EFJ50728.1 hypothetical protein VOLCADRAFT_88551 [Volvox carteri f. nagariensis]|eukprot:XP_002948321.1 hypothetical protein VOLCADRAFT_88551 [Volvox carteri f. nagariensis]
MDLQACICPAAVLAANVSLLDGEDGVSHAHGIPCAGAFAIGPRGLEEYRRVCRSQLACGVLCMGLPVVYTENLIQRQRIRGKYGLKDATSLSEIGAGCCYPCSIFQSHTYLYVSTHRPVNRPTGVTAPHGPLSGALRAKQRGTPSTLRSQETALGQQGSRKAQGVASTDPKSTEQSRLSYVKPQPDALGPDAAKTDASRQTLMPHTANAGQGGVSASAIASSVAPASSSIPPPEVTDSPRVGAPPVDPTDDETDDAASELTDSASLPIPSALPISATMRSPPRFDVPPALRPPDSANSEVISAWMEGPKLSKLSSPLQPPADATRDLNEEASSAVPPSKPPGGPAASGVGMSVSDASLFSLALDPAVSYAPPAATPEPSAGNAPSGARVVPPLKLPLPPLPTPGSSRDLQPATYDTITSSKLSSMIDHAMLNGSGSAGGRGSGSTACGSGIGLSSMDPGGPWESYRHTAMTPIAEGDAEEVPRSSNKFTQLRVVQEEHKAAATNEAPAPKVSLQRLPPANSRNSRRHLNGSGSSAGSSAGLSVRSTQGSQRGSGSGTAASGATGHVCAGGAALTALARMGSDSGNNSIALPTGSARAGNVYKRNPVASPVLRPNPPPAAPPPARAAAAAVVRDSDPRFAGAGGDEEDDVDDGMGASADNFSFAGTTPQQVLLRVSPQPARRQGSSQGRYGTAVESPAIVFTAAQRPAPTFRAPGDEDEVNFASIRPSFIDGPEMEGLKSVLRTAGEETEAGPAAPPAPSTAQAAPAGTMSTTTSGRQRVVALSSTVTTLQQRGSGSRRYDAARTPPPSAATAAGSGAFGEGAAAGPYASFCGDAVPLEDDAAALDEDASSVIDGPVSSGEGDPVITGPPAVSEPPCDGCGGTSNRDDASAGGDASVSIAVAEVPRGATIDPAESSAFGLTRRSVSGLSNGEPNGDYESMADSMCASQQRQKHWVNWMSQSVGMSMANSVIDTSRVVRPANSKPVGGGSKAHMERTSSYISVNQRLPRPVLEESGDDVYRQWA